MPIAEFIYTEVLKPKPLKALTNAILLRIIPDKIQIGPATLYLDPCDPVVSGALTLRVYELSEQALFAKYLHGDMTLVDIGANLGLYTIVSMHHLDAGGRIIAFEPYPQTYEILQKNVTLNQSNGRACPRVDTFNLAATPEPARLELRLNPENRADNRMYRGTYQGKVESWDSIPVEGRPVDDVLAEQGIQEVNFVKIDIQGYEQKAISGFRKTLARSQNVILLSEFWPKGLLESGGSPTEYLQMLIDLGFTLYTLNERPHGSITPLEDWEALIARLPGRKYTDIVGVKGYDLSQGTD
ncbi:MAG: FkbM family methyltransferase [Anaerolineales bacterium]|nr:FkbM family methyltransferase [Anaerolineales bacterium]